MEVKEIPISAIKVQNRARVEKGDIEELAASIVAHGLIQPITVDQNMRLLAGERRLLAHKHLGLQTIPAVVRSSNAVDALEVELVENLLRKNMTWPETCALQKRIFEEKSKKGKWSQTKQAEMLGKSQPQVSRQIQMAEALELLPELAQCANFDEAWRELQSLGGGLEEKPKSTLTVGKTLLKPATQLPPSWAESSYIVTDVMKALPALDGKPFDFVEVDVPFTDADEYGALYDFIARETYRLLRPNGVAIFWYGWEWHSEVRFILQTAGFDVGTVPAIWAKGILQQKDNAASDRRASHEPFWIVRKPASSSHYDNPTGDIFNFSPSGGSEGTTKPIALLECLLQQYCTNQSKILVPFAGSGVTIRAAHKLQISAIGFGGEADKTKFLKTVERSEDA